MFAEQVHGVCDHEPCCRRLVIFFSVGAQKVLLRMAHPLATFGSTLENWLNLLTLNQGFVALLVNYFKGKVVHPDKTSSSFLSFVGYLDNRIELDSEIRHGDARYYAALSVMAAKASYENSNYIQSAVKDHWKMDFIQFNAHWNDYEGKASTEAFVMEDKNDVIIVAFRGTETFDADAWSLDLDLSWYDLPPLGKIHCGFLKALGLQKGQGWPVEQDADKPETAYYGIRKLLRERLQRNEKAKFIVTGHSLGGALAVLFPAVLALHQQSWMLDRLEAVYTFGQPRVGDKTFTHYMSRAMEKHGINYYRIVYSFDIVPRLPWDNSTLMFKHFGTCIYFNSLYQGKVVGEEPNKNYYSIKWAIPKIVNAWWELMRSFIIPYMKGAAYKEGSVLRVMRMIGILLSAGVSAHCPQDYVNSIRLGSPYLFRPIPSTKPSRCIDMDIPNDDQNSQINYLELKPRGANILGILRVLSSDDYTEECKGFIKSVEAKEEIAERRGVVFVSMLAQKLLQYIDKPLSLLGSGVEMSLNILCNTTNFQIFFKNLFRGKVVVPNMRSASFVSINGHLDSRVDLDCSIKPGTNKYFAALSAMASKLAYENDQYIKLIVEKIWKMELLGTFSFWDDRYEGDTTQAFIFRDNITNPDTIVVAFRGTEPFNADDWSTDFDISWCSLQPIQGRLHRGFVKALGLLPHAPLNAPPQKRLHAYSTITQVVSSHFKMNSAARLIVTGHSLGGALAVLFSAALVMHDEIELLERLEAVYTFGQPRVGDAEFGKFMEEKFKVYGVEYIRFVYNHDIVPRLPFDSLALMFKHFGKCISVNSLYEATIVGEEPSANYFEWRWVVARRVDAMWEVVRSFLLPRMFGADYKEGLALLMFRMIGFVVPGVPDHALQDYVNATRLAIY